MLSVCQPFLLSIYLVYLTCSKSTALPAKLQVEYAKTEQFCEPSWKKEMLARMLMPQVPLVSAIFPILSI